MAAYRRVYDSCHLQDDWQESGSAPDPTLGYRVWATFTFFQVKTINRVPTPTRAESTATDAHARGDGDVILFHIYAG